MSQRPVWRIAVEAVMPGAKALFRLARDERIPGRTRMLAAGALAYALLPVDLIPDRLPVLGKVDDVGLAAVGLVRLVAEAGPDLVREHWDGDEETLEAFLGAVGAIEGLIPKRILRLAEALER